MEKKTMNDTPNLKRINLFRIAEWLLVVFGAADCLVVIFLFAGQQGQELWPLPGLYFIEIMLLAIYGAGSWMVPMNKPSAIMRAAPWVVGGALVPFVILGVFTIGLFIFPAMLAFILAGILVDLHLKKGLATHFSLAAMSALIQAAFMVLVNVLLR
jgi:hypothetical protein